MTNVEQHKMILELREHQRKMDRYEQEEFQMFLKRDKDDEFLDELSQEELQKMYDSYVVRKTKGHDTNMSRDEALKALFKKSTGNV
jgi:Trp operon repressor